MPKKQDLSIDNRTIIRESKPTRGPGKRACNSIGFSFKHLLHLKLFVCLCVCVFLCEFVCVCVCVYCESVCVYVCECECM